MKRKFIAVLIAAALTTTAVGINNGVKANAPDNMVGVSYSGYVQNMGWQTPVTDGQEVDGKGYRVEALKLNLTNAPKGASIEYQAHVQNVGWQKWVSDGIEAGTDGKNLRVEAFKIKLKNMPGYSVQYRAHVQNVGWQDWVSDGQEAGTDGENLRVEALKIKIVKISDNSTVGVSYAGHVQNVGWQDPVENGQIAGTEGQGLRVEALKLNLENAPVDAHIRYQTHVQNIGWQNPVSDGQEGGTDGKSYRVEAIKITLQNLPGYSVQYRAHVENIGWQPWVSDGDEAGTDGKGLRVEAIEVRIMKTTDGSTPTPVDFIPVITPSPNTSTDGEDHAVLPQGFNGGSYEYVGIPLNNYTLTNEVNDKIGKTKNPTANFIDDHGNKGSVSAGIDSDAKFVSTGEMTKEYMKKDIEISYKDNNGGLYTSDGKVYKLAGIYTESTKLDSNNLDKLSAAAKTLNTQFMKEMDSSQMFDRVYINYEGNTNEIVRVVVYFTPAK